MFTLFNGKFLEYYTINTYFFSSRRVRSFAWAWWAMANLGTEQLNINKLSSKHLAIDVKGDFELNYTKFSQTPT